MNEIDKNCLTDLLDKSGFTSSFQIQPINPEASNRRYFRIVFDDQSSENATLIFCKDRPIPEPQADDFLTLTNYLSEKGLPVPRIFGVDYRRGGILLSDGGEDLFIRLERSLRSGESEIFQSLVFRSIDILVRLHKLEPVGLVSRRVFDKEKLSWELDFFSAHLSRACEEFSIPSPLTFEVREFFTELSGFLASQLPLVFTHRDFHCRNILFRESQDGAGNDELTLVDYQDARMGLPWYDLSSLIFDPYLPLNPLKVSFLEDCLRYYQEQSGFQIPGARNVFYGQSIQRLFKALGSYLFLGLEKDAPDYLNYIEPTLNRAEIAVQLGSYPDSVYIFIMQLKKYLLPVLQDRLSIKSL